MGKSTVKLVSKNKYSPCTGCSKEFPKYRVFQSITPVQDVTKYCPIQGVPKYSPSTGCSKVLHHYRMFQSIALVQGVPKYSPYTGCSKILPQYRMFQSISPVKGVPKYSPRTGCSNVFPLCVNYTGCLEFDFHIFKVLIV